MKKRNRGSRFRIRKGQFHFLGKRIKNVNLAFLENEYAKFCHENEMGNARFRQVSVSAVQHKHYYFPPLFAYCFCAKSAEWQCPRNYVICPNFGQLRGEKS